MKERIEKDLKEALSRFGPRKVSREVYDYALFPPGKLFRAKLVWAMGLEEGEVTKDRRLLAVSLEFHHAYTLIHDDLPCMDDAQERRNRPSVHRRFNEWKALLTGDGLLNLSYRILGEIEHGRARSILKIFSHCLGPKGLVLGQYRDLSLTKLPLAPDFLEIHELKTARLIQCALLGSYLLGHHVSYRQSLRLAKLGQSLGIVFQLLDDLGEWARGPLEGREKIINPWGNEGPVLDKVRLANLIQALGDWPHVRRIVSDHLGLSLKTMKRNAMAHVRPVISSLEEVFA